MCRSLRYNWNTALLSPVFMTVSHGGGIGQFVSCCGFNTRWHFVGWHFEGLGSCSQGGAGQLSHLQRWFSFFTYRVEELYKSKRNHHPPRSEKASSSFRPLSPSVYLSRHQCHSRVRMNEAFPCIFGSNSRQVNKSWILRG